MICFLGGREPLHVAAFVLESKSQTTAAVRWGPQWHLGADWIWKRHRDRHASGHRKHCVWCQTTDIREWGPSPLKCSSFIALCALP